MSAAVPLDAVRSSMRITADQISRTSGPGFGAVRDGCHPVRPALPHGRRQSSADGAQLVVIVVVGTGGRAAVGVDRIVMTGRIVVRPLPPLTPASAIVAGASLDAEGNPQLVLDPEGIVAEALHTDSSDAGSTARTQPILVIDDSLTTRMLEQSILESAGYEVDAAVSAETGSNACVGSHMASPRRCRDAGDGRVLLRAAASGRTRCCTAFRRFW